MTTSAYKGQGIDLGGAKITNSGSPSGATDLATKGYVDNIAAGLDPKQSVRAASTTNVTVTAPGTTIDGVTLATNDRVLLKNQTTASENGIYQFNGSAAALTRTADAIQGTLTPGANVFVEEGTTNGDKAFLLTTDGAITVGTTAQTWSPYGTGTTYTAGNGISISSNQISVVPKSGGGLIVDGTGVSIDSTSALLPKRANGTVASGSQTVVIAHGMGAIPIAVVILDTSGNEVFPDLQVDATNITLGFNTAPTSNQYTWRALA